MVSADSVPKPIDSPTGSIKTEQAFAIIVQLLSTVNALVNTVAGLTDKIDGLAGSVQSLTDSLSALLSNPKSLPIPSSSPSPTFDPQSVVRSAYEAAATALRDSNMIQDKASRAVIVGLKEASTGSQTDRNDQAIVGALCDWSGDDKVKASFTEGNVHFHRHPPNAAPDKRPLKIQFPSNEIRDRFLKGIRGKGGRPPPLNNCPRAYVRRDLTPTELMIERERKKEVIERNKRAGKIAYGLRDTEIITYRNPRSLPTDYGRDHARPQFSDNSVHSAPLNASPPASPSARANNDGGRQ